MRFLAWPPERLELETPAVCGKQSLESTPGVHVDTPRGTLAGPLPHTDPTAWPVLFPAPLPPSLSAPFSDPHSRAEAGDRPLRASPNGIGEQERAARRALGYFTSFLNKVPQTELYSPMVRGQKSEIRAPAGLVPSEARRNSPFQASPPALGGLLTSLPFFGL